MIPIHTPHPGHLLQHVESLFDQAFGRSRPAPAPRDEHLHESEDAWTLSVDLPGFRKDEVKLVVRDRTLAIRAESAEPRPFTTPVAHEWKLGPQVRTDEVRARLEHGVLEVTLPKRLVEERGERNIEIL